MKNRGTVTIWVPMEELNLIAQGKKPSKYFFQKPAGPDRTLCETQIPISVYEAWGNTKKLLTD